MGHNLYSQDLTVVSVDEALLRTDTKVESLRWSDNDEYFSYTQPYFIHLAETKHLKDLYRLSFKQSQSSTFWTTNLMSGNFYMSVGQNGKLGVWNQSFQLKQKQYEPDLILQLDTDRDFALSACSKDGMYIATATKEGDISVYFYLRMTQQTLRLNVNTSSSKPVYSIVFSPDNRYIAFAHTDGTVAIYDTGTLDIIKEYDCWSKSKIPPVFSGDSQNIAYLKNNTSIEIINLQTDMKTIIDAQQDIKAINLLPDTNYVAFQQSNDYIRIYSIDDKGFLGSIPSFSAVSMTSYAFSNSGEYVLQGFEDGTIHKVHIYIATEADLAARGIQNSLIPEGSGNGGSGSTNFAMKGDGIMPYVGGLFISSHRQPGISVGAQYSITSMITPMSTGIIIEGFCAFPIEHNNYSSVNKDKSINSPKTASLDFKVPVGLYYNDGRKDFMLGAELVTGVKLTTLITIEGNQYAKSKIYPCVIAGGQILAYYKNIGGVFGVAWDPIFYITPYINIGYRVPMAKSIGRRL